MMAIVKSALLGALLSVVGSLSAFAGDYETVVDDSVVGYWRVNDPSDYGKDSSGHGSGIIGWSDGAAGKSDSSRGGGNGNGDQPASLVGIVHAENDAAIAPFCVNHPGPGPAAFARGAKGALYRELVAAGVEPSYASPTLFRMQSGLYAFMANHEYGVKLDDPDGITIATVRARRELDALITALVRRDPTTWKGLRLVVTADQLGHRAARRIHGRYTLTIDDLMAGRRFDDAVSDCALQLDVHGVTQADNRVAGGHTAGRTIKPYQIPLGACRAKDLDNLYMAGRCISGDFLSQASYRVTGPAVEMGEGVVRRIFGV